MSRYIDADHAEFRLQCRGTYHGVIAFDTVKAVLNDAPSIDIVRCEECKNNYNKVLNHGKMKPRCDFTDRVLTEDDFCSRGEREGE